MSEYKILTYSISNIGKDKNGDHCLFEYIDEEHILLAVVADGVSKQPCDWFASETTCKKLIENFKNQSGNQDIAKRLLSSIHQTNQYVLSIDGPCYKMASTLSSIAWDTTTDKIFYANIGDSRIYTLRDGSFSQITKDDAIITKEKVYTRNGLRVIDQSTLTKVIGQAGITVHVEERPFSKDEIIVLATDGFYEARKATLTKIMIDFSMKSNFVEGFQSVIDKVELLRGDDLTTIVIKRL